jgi:hypothetical protein
MEARSFDSAWLSSDPSAGMLRTVGPFQVSGATLQLSVIFKQASTIMWRLYIWEPI